jgi:hypothetical protein
MLSIYASTTKKLISLTNECNEKNPIWTSVKLIILCTTFLPKIPYEILHVTIEVSSSLLTFFFWCY